MSLRVALLLLALAPGKSSSKEWFQNISTRLFDLPGDILIGGLFPINDASSNLSEQLKPNDIECSSLDPYGLGLAIVMKYAVDEVNANPKLLPGIRLGYKIHDTCRQSSVIIRPTISFLTEKSTKVLSVQCNYTDYETSVAAVIGPNGSEMVSVIGKLLGFFLMPQISHRATSDQFSDKSLYPSFFRTVPSDKWLVEVTVLLIKEFEWNWVAVVGSEEEYGQRGVQEFSKLAEKSKLCVAYQALIPVYTDPAPAIEVIINNIKASNVSVIVVFSLSEPTAALFREVVKHQITGVWIASTSWANRVFEIPGIQSIGTVIGFTDKMESVDLLVEYAQVLFMKISKENLKPTQQEQSESHNPCPQCWNLSVANISLMEQVGVKQAAFSVYAALYSVAEALHKLLLCDDKACDWKPETKVYPWKVPVSTCSAACDPGQVRRVKGFHSCCFDCIDCQPGTYQADAGQEAGRNTNMLNTRPAGRP
uniref:Taste receptor type 1 member 3 n=2 Tax=Knipowitschia caucasica TaxID=637954 RepID=A0AAV2M3K2_KNICA